MGSAQLDILAIEQAAQSADSTSQHASPDLRQQAAQRLAAHRQRRRTGSPETPAPSQPRQARPNPIATAVAERYAQTPSYRAVLAEQAQRAIDEAARQAEAAAAEAEVAARNAEAIAAVQHELLAELDLWTAPQEFTPATAQTIVPAPTQLIPVATPPPPALLRDIPQASLTVRLDDNFTRPRVNAAEASTNAVPQPSPQDADEALALDDEIAFRQEPVSVRLSDPFTIEPPTPLAANLLEFPRQLVATRKARPRLAEGPLAEEPPRNPQLRIFEVQPEQVATTPTPFSVAPEWANIHLDAHVANHPHTTIEAAAHAPSVNLPVPQTAPFKLRVMAVTVDLVLIASAFLGFVAIAAHIAQEFPTGIPAAIITGVVLLCLYALYQALFFTLSEQTPGMRYARLGFCTLEDDNPTRSAIRRRFFALGVALCPIGLGVFWAIFDEDRLGWHDRISRMYPRAY